MQLEPFKLERFFAKYEFNVEHQMSASDCEPVNVGKLLEIEDKRRGPAASDSAVQHMEELHLGYTESTGDQELRRAISRLYSGISPDGILVAAPEELIFLLLQGHLSEDDHVIVTTPAYQSLSEIPRSLGCKVTKWEVELKNGEWQLDFEFLKQKLDSRTKLLIINLPHNPTGLAFTRAEKDELVRLLRRNNTMLLADEMYWQLEYGKGTDTTPFCDLYENAVSLSGLSKSYGLPGLRIGWLATQTPELLQRAAELKDYTTICNSAPSEFLALLAVRNSERLVSRCKNIISVNLKLFEQLTRRYPEKIELLPGGGGSILFPRFIDGRSAERVSMQLIEEQNLLMLPGPLFEMPERFFRVGLGRESLPIALAKFEEIL
ncbi:MAG: aminotransferase class I/II-fold pyridoxal phosphate-dependent enzyme [Spirochaetota bacterium]